METTGAAFVPRHHGGTSGADGGMPRFLVRGDLAAECPQSGDRSTGAARARTLPNPPPRPGYGLMLLLVPAATWVVALGATRRLKPDMQRMLERWGDRDEEEECASPDSGQLKLPHPTGMLQRALKPGVSRFRLRQPPWVCLGRAKRARYRFIEACPPPLWQPRPRGSRPPGGSCDPLVPQAPSPASCLPRCETARRSGRRP